MTEPLQNFTLPPAAADQVRWLDLADAARLCGKSERHLRRLCGEEWLSQGKAKTVQEDGIKPKWKVRSDADPAFNLVSAKPQDIPIPAAAFDARSIPKPILDKALNKLRILNEWRAMVEAGYKLGWTKAQSTEHYLARMPEAERISRAILYKWDADSRHGVANLTDKRSQRAKSRQEDKAADPFLAEIKHLYLHQNGRSFQFCYDHAMLKAQDLGWTITTPSLARRFILGLDQREVILRREGPEAFKNKVQSHIDRDYSGLESNEFWDADHHQFDVLVKVGERLTTGGEIIPVLARPWLSAWQDIRSRKIVGYIIRNADPNTQAIIESLGKACRVYGVPRTAYTDNGKDYDSKILTGITKSQRWQNRKVHVKPDQKQLGGIYAALGVEHIHAWPYHGQSKPIERFFRTVCERFSKQFDTYCGRNTVEKPEQLADMIQRGHFPTLEEFIQAFNIWVEADYHHRIHTGDSMDCTPHQAWENHLVTKRTAPADLLDLLMQPRIGPIRVGQHGINVNKLQYGKSDLSRWFGQQVYVRIQATVNTVSVWSEADEHLCNASLNERVPFNASPELLRQAINEQKSDTKALKASFAPKLRIHETVADRMRRLADNTTLSQADPSLPPATVSPIRSDLEGQLNSLQTAYESAPLRKAVGAESMSFDALENAFGRREE